MRKLALAVLLVGCHRPVDVGPIRAELAKDVPIVCAPPERRPPHGPAASTAPSVDEIEAASTQLCGLDVLPQGQLTPTCSWLRPLEDACRAKLVEAEAPLGVLVAGLPEGPAGLGAARHAHLLYGASVDMSALAKGDFDAAASLQGQPTCYPDASGVDEMMLASARRLAEEGHTDAALARCADFAAMQRDLVLGGTMLDAMRLPVRLENATRICTPFIPAATPEEAKRFADALASIRGTLPELTQVLPRDRAEVMLSTLGQIRDPGLDLSCVRARRLATRAGAATTDPRELKAARQAWDEIVAAGQPSIAKYTEQYEKGILALDALIVSAAQKSKPN